MKTINSMFAEAVKIAKENNQKIVNDKNQWYVKPSQSELYRLFDGEEAISTLSYTAYKMLDCCIAITIR